MNSPPLPPPAPAPATAAAPPLLASIDMGSNSFKLLLVRSLPSGRLLPVDRRSIPVLLGRRRRPDLSLPLSSQLAAADALRSLFRLLPSHRRLRVVATAAIRAAPNRLDFLSLIRSELGLEIDVLSGEDEARLTYLGILQSLPIFHRSALAVDIGGGSTELVLGFRGEVLFAASLDLGHVSLTESFAKSAGQIDALRLHVRSILRQSTAIDKIRDLGFEIAVGSSGTIKSIKRAISRSKFLHGGFGREELELLVGNLCSLGFGNSEGVRRLGFSQRRADFVVAGAVLLLEIFESLGIREMEVSGYALGEGVIAEMMASDSPEFDVSANARWQSVVGLAERFDSASRMKMAVQCAGIAKDIFEGIRMCGGVALDDKDFEYLEAAMLLHSSGLVVGKKGHHKLSYHIIKNSGHLHGYSSEEIELIALLARFHRKKFPRLEHPSLREFSVEVKKKFRILCIIMRLSLGLQQCLCMTSRRAEVLHTHEGFELAVSRLEDHQQVPDGAHLTSAVIEAKLRLELEHFEEVFRQKISVSMT